MEYVCKNCKLYDGPTSTCAVRAIVAGEVFRNIPVGPNDPCIWEEMGIADHIKQLRFRVFDPETGEPTNKKGKVVIEYDKDFFGPGF